VLPECKFKAGVVLQVPFQAPQPILEYAALHGFRSLTVPYMRKLIDVLAVPSLPGKKPTLEAEVATVLIRHYLPAADDALVARCLGHRQLRDRQPPFPSSLGTDSSKVLEEAFQHDDTTGQELLEQTKAASVGKKLAEKPPIVVLKSSKEYTPYTAKVLLDKDALLARARLLLPLSKGCSIAIHKDTSWMVKYFFKEPPNSSTISFGADSSRMQDALKECLQWAWEAHVLATGVPMPPSFKLA
jgi:hypothetical protein